MRILLIATAVLAGGEAVAGPKLLVPITSGDQIGLSVKGREAGVPGGSAMLGMWSDDGALELAGFRSQASGSDPATARAAEIVSGRAMQSRGVRLTGRLYRRRNADARGWTVSVDARRQETSDLGAALSGTWRTLSDSRLTFGGRLRF